jgi:hypothetical protein
LPAGTIAMRNSRAPALAAMQVLPVAAIVFEMLITVRMIAPMR